MEAAQVMTFSEAVKLVVGKVEGWLETSVTMLPNMIVAVVVLIAFYGLARLARYTIQKLSKKMDHEVALVKLTSNVAYVSVIIVGMFVALSVLNLDKTVTSLLAGAGIVGLALGFAFQDTAANFLSGVMIATRQPYKLGDIIEAQNHMGAVDKINLRTTTLRSFQGQLVLIPNKELFQNIIVNYSTGERRVDLELGVSYADDLEKAEQVAVNALKDLEFVMKDRSVDLFYDEFGSSSINFSIRFWIDYPDHPSYLKARSIAVKEIKSAFDENDITIPFPIRTLDFGVKGGESLTSVLEEVYAEAS